MMLKIFQLPIFLDAYNKFLSSPLVVMVLLGLVLSGLGATSSAQEKSISYDRQIRPILSDRCFACHGPDAETREAGLRLDVADGEEGAHEFAIVPGSIEDSELWNRIISEDASEVMPPPDAHKKSLSESEKELIKRWIEEGANYEPFWAFASPRKPVIPSPVYAFAPLQKPTPIDQFVLRSLEQKNASLGEIADPRTLIRRLTLDLTGLPPTREEITEFLADRESMGHDRAWQKLMDELLARPSFGENIARHWLDLVRFADTNGMHKDFYRNHVEYRDWVIRAFNDNLGYDDFLKFQLAGDLYDNPTEDQLIASGFHRLHLIIDRGTALPEESFTKNVIDRVTAVGTGFMGLTVHCAQCHDHKYDPITQKDFFSLYAFFNNIDAQPETVARPEMGLQQPFVSLATPEEAKKLAALDKKLNSDRSRVSRFEKKLKELKARQLAEQKDDAEANKVAAEISKEIAELNKKLAAAKKSAANSKRIRASFNNTIRYAMTMKERPEVRKTFVLNRGQYDSPGEEVSRDTPGFLPSLKKESEVATRMDLAEWFVQPDHPLTSRVAVNRFWQLFFGVGLVKTSEDFGAQGESPSHPELLDYLSVEFVESGWDVKRLVRQIVLSRTYCLSSRASSEQFKLDPENRMLSRGSRFRLDAELIRDQILASSGLLNRKMYGPSVKPPQPDGLWKAVTMTGERFSSDKGDAIYRRSIYTYWKRGMPPPQMTILNAPNRDACIARRERTNTPSQALLLLNEKQYFKAARALALKTLEQEPEQRISFIWEVVTSKLPDEDERTLIAALLVQLQKKYEENSELAKEICGDIKCGDGIDQSEVAAWTVIGNTLYNLDITKTRE